MDENIKKNRKLVYVGSFNGYERVISIFEQRNANSEINYANVILGFQLGGLGF